MCGKLSTISLPPIPAKCLERFVYDAMCDHIFLYLAEWQHCFIKSRSCVTHLILTHHYWAKSFDNGCQVHVALLDFSKDFDGVSQSVLLKRYAALGFLDLFLDGMRVNLTDRRQRVLIEG